MGRNSLIEQLEHRLFLAAQAYDWKNVVIKGNGFLDGIVYSQAAPNVAYTHADVGGAYRLDPTTNTWTPLTDWIGTNDAAQFDGAVTMAVDPTDPNNLYMVAGTYQSTAAFLRSSDQGRTWQRTDVSGIQVNGNGWGRGIGERLAVDPNLPSTIFYGANWFTTTSGQTTTNYRGLWKSTDSSATWNQVTTFTNYGDVWNNNFSSANGVGLPFVIFDKSSGTAGTATPRIYVASDSAASTNTKLYTTADGGVTWAPIANQPTTTNFPLRSTLSADGSVMYVTYGSQAGPLSSADVGGVVYKISNPSSASPTWTVITPTSANGASGATGLFTAIAIDPTNSNILYTSAQNNFPCNIWRSIDGGNSWTALNPNNNRVDTSAPYAAGQSIHWLTDIEIDPFNHNTAMINTGYGIYRTTNLTATTPSWSFYNDGLEETAQNSSFGELASPNTGTAHLFDAIGDRDGYRHDDLTLSPMGGTLGQSNGMAKGNSSDIDVAFNDSTFVVRTVSGSPFAQFSVNNGTTWSSFGTAPSGSSAGGQIQISADGTRAVWDPAGTPATVFSTRTGNSWSAWTVPTTGRPANNAILVTDLTAVKTFYAYASATIARSTDGGATWTIMSTSAPTGATWIRAVPGQAGNLVMSRGGSGLYRSQDGGATWSHLANGVVSIANQVGVGAPAVPGGYPSIFVGGTVSGVTGFYRSDDQGATWVMINDLGHQYGSTDVIQGDPRVYGRLFVGTNGRGILVADIHTAATNLPDGWSTTDIGSVGTVGSAGQITGGSTWDITGGGAGINGSADAFRYAYTSLTGNGSITALVTDVPLGAPNSLNNGYNAEAGLMIRDGTAAGNANAFLSLTPGSQSFTSIGSVPTGGAIFQSRGSANGSTTFIGRATTGVYPPYWLRLVRFGDVFTAYASPDGTTWTLLGTQTISMSATVNIGLAVTSSNNTQVDISHFQNVTIDSTSPTVNDSSYLSDTALNKVSFTFSETPSAHDLVAGDLTFVPTAGGSNVTASAFSLNGSTITFTLPVPLADGDYTATLSGVQDAAFNPMTPSATLPFFVLQGDANRDRTVNALDFNALAANYGASGPNTLADGDFNYDGHVDTADFGVLADQFGVTLAPLPGAQLSALPLGLSAGSPAAQAGSPMSATPSRNLFGSTLVNLAEDILE